MCDVRRPSYEHGVGASIGRYAVYLSQIEDDTQFDSACPYHGDGGSMVLTFCRSRWGR